MALFRRPADETETPTCISAATRVFFFRQAESPPPSRVPPSSQLGPSQPWLDPVSIKARHATSEGREEAGRSSIGVVRVTPEGSGFRCHLGLLPLVVVCLEVAPTGCVVAFGPSFSWDSRAVRCVPDMRQKHSHRPNHTAAAGRHNAPPPTPPPSLRSPPPPQVRPFHPSTGSVQPDGRRARGGGGHPGPYGPRREDPAPLSYRLPGGTWMKKLSWANQVQGRFSQSLFLAHWDPLEGILDSGWVARGGGL